MFVAAAALLALVPAAHQRDPAAPPLPFLFHAAPMQCYTNRHLRRLFRCCSANTVLWTEMEKADDLLASAKAADRRLRHDGEIESPLVLQLGGSDPDALARATSLGVEEYGFREVNLNCGCPSVEVRVRCLVFCSLFFGREFLGRALGLSFRCSRVLWL